MRISGDLRSWAWHGRATGHNKKSASAAWVPQRAGREAPWAVNEE